jgi:hypothetical protein
MEVLKMGIIEDIVAEGLTKAWGMMPDEKKNQIREGTIAGEKGLEMFNKVTEDKEVSPAELEEAIKMIMDAMGGTAGQAMQAYLWSLFKHA